MRIYLKHRIIIPLVFTVICILIIFYHFISNIHNAINLNDDDSLSIENHLDVDHSVLQYRIKRYEEYKKSESSRSGVGEYGRGVSLTNDEIKNLGNVMNKEAFNRPLSDRVSVERSLPDYRSYKCKNVVYPKDLPTLSVIVIFIDEAFSTLIRTAHSVIHRTNPNILKEIIFLDDNSSKSHLMKPLENYIRKTWPDGIVKLLRSKVRLGLIKARLEGAKNASGDVLMFLDSHCEVTEGWAEPLLYRIYQKRETMMIPVIEGVDAKNLAYYGSSELGMVGTFWWSMHFTWETVPPQFKAEQKSETDPIKSPTMAGGLFAVDRKYFFEIGAYDEGMLIWGGENLEISFRTWLCGGTLESSPCSHVGHIFRASHPYSFPDNKDYHGLNSKRMVDVWLDEYSRLFYMHRLDLKNRDAGNISSRLELRKRLNCKPFKWYIQNVVPHKFIPDENVLGFGYFQNPITKLCLDLLGQNEFDHGSLTMGLFSCQGGASGGQIFSFKPIRSDSKFQSKSLELTKRSTGQIRREWGCITATGFDGLVKFLDCDPGLLLQQWVWDTKTNLFVNSKLNQCLDSRGMTSDKKANVMTKNCDDKDPYQIWTFEKTFF